MNLKHLNAKPQRNGRLHLVAKVEIIGYKNQGGQEPNPPALFSPNKKKLTRAMAQ